MKYFLVTGSPRSGTTLLQQILNTHPCVACFHEYRLDKLEIYIDALFEEERIRSAYSEIIEANSSEFLRDTAVSVVPDNGMAQDALQLIESDPYPIPQRNRDFHSIVKAIFSATFAKNDLLAIGDKVPNVIVDNYLASLQKTYSNLVTIFILRHPFDVVRSSLTRMEKAKVGKDLWHIQTIDQAIEEWVKNWEFAASQRNESNTVFIKYENLYADFECEMDRVAALLGIDNRFTNIVVQEDRLDRALSLTSAQRQHVADRIGLLTEIWKNTNVNDLLNSYTVLPYAVSSGELIDVYSGTLPHVLREGFYPVEEWGAWTDGTKSRVILAIKGAKEAENIWMDLTYTGFVGPIGSFVFGIRVNGGNIEIIQIDAEDAMSHKANLGRMYIVKGGVVEIEISVPRPKKPEHDPASDSRTIGFGIKSLCVTII